MIDKKWYDDWEVRRDMNGDIKVSVPHAKSKYDHIVFTGEIAKNESVKWLVDIIDCVLTELSARDKEKRYPLIKVK